MQKILQLYIGAQDNNVNEPDVHFIIKFMPFLFLGGGSQPKDISKELDGPLSMGFSVTELKFVETMVNICRNLYGHQL